MAGISEASRDNTGSREFFDGTVLPSIAFPSDHAVVSALFHLRRNPLSPTPEEPADEPAAQGRGAPADAKPADSDPQGSNPAPGARGPATVCPHV
jgi:hypothetical protein